MADETGKDDGAKQGLADDVVVTNASLDAILNDWPQQGLTWTLANEVVNLRVVARELHDDLVQLVEVAGHQHDRYPSIQNYRSRVS